VTSRVVPYSCAAVPCLVPMNLYGTRSGLIWRDLTTQQQCSWSWFSPPLLFSRLAYPEGRQARHRHLA
jgi:hypothetical protein